MVDDVVAEEKIEVSMWGREGEKERKV